jgi:hypothetical protein
VPPVSGLEFVPGYSDDDPLGSAIKLGARVLRAPPNAGETRRPARPGKSLLYELELLYELALRFSVAT